MSRRTAAGLLIAILVLSCAGLWALGRSRGSLRASEPVRVSYRVSGSAPGASLTYRTESGDTEQKDVYSLPWQRWIDARPGQFLYVAAQSTGYGAITCEILVGEVVVKKASSEGQYKIATCSGTL